MNRPRATFYWRIGIITIGALLAVALAALAGPLALRGPRVISITPHDGAADANPQASIRVEFDQWVPTDAVARAVQFDPPAEFTVVPEGRALPWRSVVLIQPKGGLRYGAQYRLTLNSSLKNMLGRALEQPQSIAFKTVPFVTVVRQGPEDGAEQVQLNAPITVEFGTPVVPAEAIAAAAEDPQRADALPQPLALEPQMAGVGRWLSPTLFGFSPADGLHAATRYTVTIRPEITPDGKVRLERPVTWHFTTAAPLLVGARPHDGAADVAANSAVEVRLARDVDIKSAGAHFSLIEVKSGTPVSGTVEPAAEGFTFKPASLLQRSAQYEARLAAGVTSRTGATLNQQPLTWRFDVIGDPEVAQVEPPAGTTDVLPGTRRISVRFNHPIVTVTTRDAQAGLVSPLSITPALPGEGRWIDTSTFVFSPTVPLTPSTDYQVRVAAGLRDQTGGVLQQEYTWTFSTIKPQVLGSIPADGDQYAGPRDPIIIAFNQPMDLGSLRDALTLRRSDTGQPVSGSLAITRTSSLFVPNGEAQAAGKEGDGQSVSGFTVAFTPDAPLERGARYTLTVASGVRAAQGDGALASEYRSSFQAAPLPQLLSSTPVDGASAADPSGSITLYFSTPMDWASVEQHLTIEPKPTQIYTSSSEASLSLYFALQPETDYRVTVGAAAQDRFGVSLEQDASIGFRTAALPPSFSFVGVNRIGAYNAYAAARVPLQSVNVPRVHYQLYPLDPADTARLANDYDFWNQFQPDETALIREGDLAMTGQRNRQHISLIDVGQLEAGLYYLRVQSDNGNTDRQIMAVSPYALTIKRSADRLFIWAIDLASGKPVPDLALTGSTFSYNPATNRNVVSEPVDLGRTNAEGILQAAFSATNPYDPAYFWSSSKPFAFGTTTWGDGINPWDFGLPADYEQNPVTGNLSTDRPIYRPGHTVHIRGVVRTGRDNGYAMPAAGRVALTINDPEGNAVISKTLALSEFGTFNTDLPIEQGAKPGGYTMIGRLEGDTEAHSFYGSFTVAEYRKPAFEVTVTPAKTDLIQGDRLEVSIAARYFSGGPVANAPVRWRLLAKPLYFAPESAPNFRFEDLEDAYQWYRWFDDTRYGGEELVSDGTATTDAQGRLTLTLPTAPGKDNHSRTLTLDAEITDVDGQVIAAQGSASLHAGAFYIGLRPEGYVAQAGQPQPVTLITLDPQGQPVPNRRLDVKIYKREWYSVREQGEDGRFYTTSTFSDTLLETQAATTDAQGRASISFTPKEGGSYRIGAEGRDDGGHTVRASAFTWAYGGDTFWGINDTNRVDLIADKDRYKPGETANILVTAPYPDMNALLTIERGQVIEHKLLTLQGTTGVLQVPLKADYAPNVYVSVVLVKPAGGQQPADAPPVPDLRVGLVNVAVSTEQQELNISITPDRQQAGPRDEVAYTIKATDYTGKGVRAEVALALVDKAVLSLADDPNPTLQQSFYQRRPLGVFTAQSLTALVDRVTLKLQPGDKGGGGGAAGEVLVRREFPDTAYWNPALVTGDDGTASVKLTLPDSLTTWRMTARGVTADTRVGQATQDLVATRPLLVRPSLPRFLTVGDRPTLQAVVHNNTGNAIDAAVALSISDGGAGIIQPGGATEQKIQVPAGGQVVVRWPAEVRAAGTVTLRISVTGGELQDIVEQVLNVQRFTTPEVVASAGQVQDTTVETIQGPAPDAKTGTDGEVRLELVPSLAAGVESGLTYLEQYPYGCVEQTVSRFLPNAVTYRLFKQLGMDDQKLKTSLETSLAAGLQRLTQQQNLDGGWGWWGNDESNPYLTAYVVQGLLEARKAGYGVDSHILDTGVAYLQKALDGSALDANKEAWRGNARAYVLFVLAEAGRPDRGRLIALFERRANLDIYGRAYLLMALKSPGGEDGRVRTLVGELMSTAILHAADAHWEEQNTDPWTLSSDTRTTALALQALVRADPGNFLAPNAVRYLMNLREDGHWRTTQESAVTLMALTEYIAQSGELDASYAYRVTLDGRTLSEGSVNRDNLADPVNVVFKLAELKAGDKSELRIQRQAGSGQSGKGRLYYNLRMRYYQDAAAVQPLDRGVAVQREYVAVDTDTLTPTGELVSEAGLGDVVQVRLTISVPENVYHLVVEDMLPAGLEPLDTSLKTVSAAAQEPTLAEAGEERPYWSYWAQTEIHDNRVALFATHLPRGTYHYTYLARASAPGTFQTLPATAYQMYAPEVFGRSAGSMFVVR